MQETWIAVSVWSNWQRQTENVLHPLVVVLDRYLFPGLVHSRVPLVLLHLLLQVWMDIWSVCSTEQRCNGIEENEFVPLCQYSQRGKGRAFGKILQEKLVHKTLIFDWSSTVKVSFKWSIECLKVALIRFRVICLVNAIFFLKWTSYKSGRRKLCSSILCIRVCCVPLQPRCPRSFIHSFRVECSSRAHADRGFFNSADYHR